MRCREKKYTLDGWYRSKHEDRQRCRYSACGRRFWSNLGFEYRQVPRPYITPALMVWRRMAAANTQMTLRHLGRDARGRHNQDPEHRSIISGWWVSVPSASSRRAWEIGGGLRREDAEGPRQGTVYRCRQGSCYLVCADVGRIAHQGKVRHHPPATEGPGHAAFRLKGYKDFTTAPTHAPIAQPGRALPW